MRLTALVDHPDHVCCRYRIAAFRPFWASAGITADAVTLPRGSWRRVPFLFGRSFHAVILQRRLLSPLELRLLRRRARRIIFDFDDAVWLRDSYSQKGPISARRVTRFEATVRAADAVVVGNEFLARRAALVVPADRIYEIPTCVDPTRYLTAGGAARGREVQLVWIGSSSTLQGIERFAPVIDQIAQRVPGSCLKLICDRFFELERMPVIPTPWSAATEPAEIAGADIGISWLPDDDWSRGKCGLKVLQYMAAGLPVVANPVGIHPDVVRHGETGFLANTTEEWVNSVQRLAADRELRRTMGAAGRAIVERRYSVTHGAALWQSLLEKMNGSAA